MSEQLEIDLEIPPLWDTINEIRAKIAEDERIKNHGEEFINASVMVASELLENAVKYGYHNDPGQGVAFNLVVDDESITIEVTNGVPPDFQAEKMLKLVEEIKNSENAELLYTNKLMEIASNPKRGESGLGLLRIAYEGEFFLDCEYEHPILKIKAKRKI